MTKINYDVVSEIAGHQSNKEVELPEASRHLFGLVKEKAMQVAVKGDFLQFNTIEELQELLENAAVEGFSIRAYDSNIGG